MKQPDRMIPFPPHDDPEAVRRFEEETGAIQIVVVTDPLMYRLLGRLLSNAADMCFGPDHRSIDEAYASLKDRIGELNEDRQEKIPLPSFGAFKLQVTSDPRNVGSPHFQTARDARYTRRDPVAEMRRRRFWFEACSLFIEMQAAGLRIDGHFPRLDDRSLSEILPALNRAVGGEKERFKPPSARWFRRQVNRMQRGC